MICLPLTAKNIHELHQEATELVVLAPDLIEWRVDHFEGHDEVNIVLNALDALRKIIGPMPLLFTCRTIHEGGCCNLSPNKLKKLNMAAAANGQIDLLDTEISNDTDLIYPLKDQCVKSKVKLVLSYHNFDNTPEETFLIDQLCRAQDLGGDIAKVAVMPNNADDVLKLLRAAYTARTQKIDIPIIAISMGEMGAISRIAGGSFGSDITFAIGRKSSAPGQVPIENLRLHWKMLSIKK